LPYLGKMKIILVKIGGFVLDQPALYSTFLEQFSSIPASKILVHGGGRRATTLTQQLGLEPKIVDGRRITDDATLEIVTMVYAGLINKNITADLQANGCNAMGLSGADGDLIHAHKRIHPSIDFGWAGDIDKINTAFLEDLLLKGNTPVIAPITHDGKGQLFNTNADTIASAVAAALCLHHDVTLLYCFEHKGLLGNPGNPEEVIPVIKSSKVQSLIDKGIISGGMIPKVHNIQASLQQGVNRVILCAATDVKQILENADYATGTIFTL